MFAFRQLSRVIALPVTALVLAVSTSSVALADDFNVKFTGSIHSKHLIERGRSSFKAKLRTAQHVYYPGDALDLSVQFDRGGALLAANKADAFVVVYSKDGEVFAVKVPDDVGTIPRRFFKIDAIDISTLPEGQYQLGLVVTEEGGNPLKLDDWYSGFRSILDVQAIFISSKVILEDSDHDGQLDNDTDHDGLDEEEDEGSNDG